MTVPKPDNPRPFRAGTARKEPRDFEKFKRLLQEVLDDPLPRADLYNTVNALDYVDTGARLIPRADLTSLSGPCVVIKPGEKHKKAP